MKNCEVSIEKLSKIQEKYKIILGLYTILRKFPITRRPANYTDHVMSV